MDQKKLIIGGGIALFLIAILIGSCIQMNSLQQEGVQRETELNQQYLTAQNELSTYTSTFYETIGVANLKSDKMDQIITDAVKGRYDSQGSAQPDRAQLFSAIKEAYPSLDLSIYDKIVDQIRAGRKAFQAQQDKLIDMLRAYDNWRASGLFQPWFIRHLGFPSEHLEARIGKDVKHGADARDQMWLIVTTSDTKRAYETGTQDPLAVPGANPGKK